ncbi:MAG: PPC domain-containing protein [Kofleriaceae bacterium]|nr:PPC domain-containing protein [Kofleriaceae bacterium]
MLRLCLMSGVIALLAACGPKIPTHNGYKTKSPWKDPKVIVLDDQNSGHVESSLNYAAYKRAKWMAVDLPEDGDLEVKLDITDITGVAPPSEGDDEDDFEDPAIDLALEILDSNWNVITKSDASDDDAGAEKKTRSLLALSPGRYYIHVYLEGRQDTAEFEVSVKFTPVPKDPTSTFPSEVAFLPNLPIVPLHDDTPVVAKVEKKPPRHGGGHKTTNTKKPPPDPEPPSGTGPVSANIINVSVSGGGTQITINRGTDAGLADGRRGAVVGIKNGGFTLKNCTARTCKAEVKATVDEVNRSGKVSVK